MVLAREDLVSQVAERVVGDSGIVFGAKDQTDRRIFICICPMLSGIVQVEIHLSCIGVGELSKLQLDNN